MSPLWKSYSIVVSSLTIIFNGLMTWAKVCHIFNRCSFEHRKNNFMILCKSSHGCLVINPSYHTYILFTFNSFLYNVMYLFWLARSYSYTSFTLLEWTYHWWFKYPLILGPMWDWMCCSPQYSLGYCQNDCFKKWSTHAKRGFPPFPSPHLAKSIFLSPKTTFKSL
jgi:hypothetical protein